MNNFSINEFESQNASNSSWLTQVCTTPQRFTIFTNELSMCYSSLFASNTAKSIFEVLLASLTVFFNLIVATSILRKPIKANIFDKIMIAHCVVDGLTGLVDVPFYHFNNVFGYWPFGTLTSLFWSSYDNGINFITNAHMLYMTWVRYRSIRAPNTFEKEISSRYPVLVCVFIWIFGLSVWSSITFSFGVYDFSTSVNYRLAFVEIIFIFFTWFCPLLGIIVLAILICLLLRKRKRKVADMRMTPSLTNSNLQQKSSEHSFRFSRLMFIRKLEPRFRLGPQIRFQIIIISYWLQWFPSCLIALVDPICNCVPTPVSSTIYWLTYTVCLTDPLIILIFNPSVGFNSKRRPK